MSCRVVLGLDGMGWATSSRTSSPRGSYRNLRPPTFATLEILERVLGCSFLVSPGLSLLLLQLLPSPSYLSISFLFLFFLLLFFHTRSGLAIVFSQRLYEVPIHPPEVVEEIEVPSLVSFSLARSTLHHRTTTTPHHPNW